MKEMKEIKTWSLAFTYVGCFLGAGFISGQELWQLSLIHILFHKHLRAYPSATSSVIITLKPTAKNTVPRLECFPCDISGISSSTTT